MIWPVSVVGAVRFAWAVPDNLEVFQSAKVVVIPHAPGGPATLNLRICRAENAEQVTAACAGPFTQTFDGVPNELLEVDISAILGPAVGAPGLRYLAVLAFTTPTTATDHIVGLRFAYTPTPPSGLATLGSNTFSGAQTAPAFVGDGSRLTNLPMPPGVATLGANVFTGNQIINTGNLSLDDSTATTGNITKNGARFLHDFGTDNVFLGRLAGNTTMTGTRNAASGQAALSENMTGDSNTASGAGSLGSNTHGDSNTAMGADALASNTIGFGNTASGRDALRENTTGPFNTAVGDGALASNTTATGNTAVGADALQNVTTGVNNVAVGRLAGSNATTGSNNIYVGGSVLGTAGESFTMRLGGPQTRTFIKGIHGTTTGVNNAIPVLIDSLGQLGTVNSSRRFKEDIHDMANASSRLLKLRPVTFRYAQAYADGSKPQQYGLVAEEVADVFPELAVRDADGQIETVHYETLNVLLLNELQKQQRRIEALEQRLNQGR
ncbi:MAG TPA: tail fiber domain-containing protein [Vicinamibacteria bacterium]